MQDLKEHLPEPLQVGRLYYSKPDHSFIRALNLAAFNHQAGKGSTLAVVSSSFYAVEMLKRFRKLSLAGTSSFDPKLFVEHVGIWALGDLNLVDISDLPEKYEAIMWAEPKQSSARLVLEKFSTASMRGTELMILTSPSFRLFKMPKKINTRKKDQSLKPQAMISLLKVNGWDVDLTTSFYGIKAIFWNYIAEKLSQYNYPLWSDRCYQMKRAKMRESSWLWPLSRLVLIRSRRA